jgi:UV DNA damage repair endonuclease
MTQRLGFACKYMLNADVKKSKTILDAERELNTGGTTVAWLNRQTINVAEDKLWQVMQHNLTSVCNVLAIVAKMDTRLRMMRLSSDLLPMYTEKTWGYFWQKPDVKAWCETEFAKIGEFARKHDIRLSFHPGQFCCIVSDKSDVVNRSIEELEYHAKMATWMGFCKSKLDFKINVHLSGKLGADGFDAAWNQMSTELRYALTIENDEYQAGLDDILLVGDKAGLVVDLHHNWINTGKYLSTCDDRLHKVIDSWCGQRPVFHYSQSKIEILQNYMTSMPDIEILLKKYKKTDLRAHSNMYNHRILNKWALSHLAWGDMMVEGKSKNLASQQLFNQLEVST